MSGVMIIYRYMKLKSKDIKPIYPGDRLLKQILDCSHTNTIDVGDSDHIVTACIDCETVETPDSLTIDERGDDSGLYEGDRYKCSEEYIDTQPRTTKEIQEDHVKGDI